MKPTKTPAKPAAKSPSIGDRVTWTARDKALKRIACTGKVLAFVPRGKDVMVEIGVRRDSAYNKATGRMMARIKKTNVTVLV